MVTNEAVGPRVGPVLHGKKAIVTGSGQEVGRDPAIALTQAVDGGPSMDAGR